MTVRLRPLKRKAANRCLVYKLGEWQRSAVAACGSLRSSGQTRVLVNDQNIQPWQHRKESALSVLVTGMLLCVFFLFPSFVLQCVCRLMVACLLSLLFHHHARWFILLCTKLNFAKLLLTNLNDALFFRLHIIVAWIILSGTHEKIQTEQPLQIPPQFTFTSWKAVNTEYSPSRPTLLSQPKRPPRHGYPHFSTLSHTAELIT